MTLALENRQPSNGDHDVHEDFAGGCDAETGGIEGAGHRMCDRHTGREGSGEQARASRCVII